MWRVGQDAQGQAPAERTPEGGGTGAASMTPEKEGRGVAWIPAALTYEVAESADHADQPPRREHGEDAKLLPAVTSLLPLMRLRRWPPRRC